MKIRKILLIGFFMLYLKQNCIAQYFEIGNSYPFKFTDLKSNFFNPTINCGYNLSFFEKKSSKELSLNIGLSYTSLRNINTDSYYKPTNTKFILNTKINFV